MLEEKKISEVIAQVLHTRGLFLVDVKISKENDVTITIESFESRVTVDDCQAVNDIFLSTFDQDTEDYSLTVTSAGLDGEFKVPAQFEKAIGQKVELWLKGGRKVIGTLVAAQAGEVTVDETAYRQEDINKVKYYIEF